MDALIFEALGKLVGPSGPYPLGSVTIGDQTYTNFLPPAPQTLAEVFSISRSNPTILSSTFMVYNGEEMTFSQVFDAVDRLAAFLISRLGVKRGDRVAVAMRNLPELVIAYVAVTSISGVIVPLNGWWTGKELEYALQDSGATVFIADQERYSRAKPYLLKLRLEGRTILTRPNKDAVHDAILFSSIVSSASDAVPSVSASFTPQPEDDCTIMYTSGTTGHPKGVVSTHRNITSALNMLAVFSLIKDALDAAKHAAAGSAPPTPAQQCALLAIPLFHVTATHAVLLPCFYFGRKMVIMHKWDPVEALRTVENHRVTHFTGVPTMTWEMIHHPDVGKYDTSSLQLVSGGGAPTPPRMVGEVPKTFKNASPGQGFGMTESNGITTLNSATSYLAKPTSCGRAVLNVQLRIVNDDDVEVPIGNPGEVLIRGPTVMKGYWNKPKETGEVLLKDSEGQLWLRTGDIGKLDDEGYLYILDRKKDLIIRGGENISCSEVEAAVYEHSDVAEVAAFGLPDVRLGETVAVALVMKPQKRELIGEELQAFLKQTGKLANFKIPAHVFIWHEAQLPRGATGKTLKKDVRKFYADKLLTAQTSDAQPRSKL